MFTYLSNIPMSTSDKTSDLQYNRQFQLPGPSVQFLSRSIDTRRDKYKNVSPKGLVVQTAYYSQRPYPEFDIQTDTRLRGSDKANKADKNIEPVIRYLQSTPTPSSKTIPTIHRALPGFNQDTRFRQQKYTDYSINVQKYKDGYGSHV